MTSEERHEARYQRRKRKRRLIELRRSYSAGGFEKAFSYWNLYTAARRCYSGVGWKSSVQMYRAAVVPELWNARDALMCGKYRSRGFVEFDITDRGKKRHIRSVHISERTVQKCLCTQVVNPLFKRALIYDNPASTEGKGIHFAVRRLECHLQRHFRKYGTNGYALLFDFSKYFDNAQHGPIFAELDRRIHDERLREQAKYFIRQFGPVGMGLGSEISQTSALMLPNRMDHYIKEQLRIKGYARYMDDGYLLHPSKEYLQRCLKEIQRICGELGIILNPKKTRIVPIRRGFRFLKIKFTLKPTGKVVKKLARQSVIRMARKLKTFLRWVKEGKITAVDMNTSYQSWKGYAMHCGAWHTIRRMDKLFNKLLEEAIAA